MDETTMMILVNWFVCWAGVYMCACRLGHKNPRLIKPEISITYIVWMPTLVASALSWTYGEPPSIAQLSMGLAVVAHLTIGYEAWRDGPPPYARRTQA